MTPTTRPVAVVTGAAAGIGRRIAVHLALAGFDLGLTAERPLDDAVDEARQAGAEVAPVQADFRDPARAADVVERTVARFGRLDALVNNAGLTVTGPIEDADPARFDDLVAINLKAPWLAARAAVRPLVDAGGGAIVNVSSVHGQHALPGNAAYGATKGGLEAMTRQLAVELAPRRIRVNAVAPGVVEVERYHEMDWYTPEAGARLVPWPRLGHPDDVAALVSFLVSPAAEFITGQVVTVDGGTSATLALRLPGSAGDHVAD